MSILNENLPLYGYGFSAAVFLVLSIFVLANWRGRLRGRLLAATTFVTAAWSVGLAYSSISVDVPPFYVFLIELGHDAIWLVFLAASIGGSANRSGQWVTRYGGFLTACAFIAAGLLLEFRSFGSGDTERIATLLIYGSLVTALFVLVSLEQLYRNARESERIGLKYLCIAVAGIFLYQAFLYSDAILSGQISSLYWDARGFVVAMCAPFIALGVRRSNTWSTRVFVSRKVVFYATTTVFTLIYLAIISLAGYYVHELGKSWGEVGRLLFIYAAILALLTILFSEVVRGKVRVFVSKHFFANKYDYRKEWLRLILTLTSDEDGLPLKKRAIKAVAQIVDSPVGRLWLKEPDAGAYRCSAGWNIRECAGELAADTTLVQFLNESGWVVDLDEYRKRPGRYEGLDKNELSGLMDDAAFVVPLFSENELIGLVVLARPAVKTELNYEDRDLLKTAGHQIASYLTQESSTELLAESRQFEAFNRLTAYIMHDLKNLISQQSLVVQNARKHKDKPEFIDDAVATIESGVVRMRRVIEQLQQTTSQQPVEKVELGKIVLKAASRCADRSPQPKVIMGDEQVWVLSEADRLLMALVHTIRNAQDATAQDGQVSVTVVVSDQECCVEIRDTGRGMTSEFIRDRLFRPFDSTKGTQGMGIGAYQVRETVRANGGRVEVESTVGQGTLFRIVLSRQA